MSSQYNENGILKGQKNRINLLAVIVTILLAILIVRLFYLQIVEGGYYYKLAKDNATRVIYLTAPRGDILSKSGKIFVDNESSFNIAVILSRVKKKKTEFKFLAGLMHKNYRKILQKVKKEEFLPPYEPIILIRNISIKELSKFEVNKLFLKGFFIAKIPIRHYPFGKMGAQIFGYVGPVSSTELKEKKYGYLNSSDIIGETGLEYYYQKYLHGKDGEKRIVVNSKGEPIGNIVVKKPVMGANLYTTLDFSLQKLAYKLMKKREGAVIAVNPNNGKILAMVSTPSFNPFYFSEGISRKHWDSIINNDEHPLQNKGIQNALAPGSTFKAVASLAALSLHLITPEEKIYSGPTFKLGNAVFYNWNPYQNSKVNLYRAIAESVDTYFYSIGVRIGIDQLADYAHRLGLGEKTGIDLPDENPGFIPTKRLVYKRYHSRWYKGSTLSAIIGQSYDLVSPIQLLMAYSAIANGGNLYRPFLLQKIVSWNGKILKEMKPKFVRRINIKQKYLNAVKKGLCGVVSKNYGTAINARIKGIKFCGKTGTAQIISKTYSIYDIKYIPRKYRDNAWFVGFAPLNDPKIAVVVLDMHARFLGANAAVIAKKIVEKYLEQKGLWKPPLHKKNEKGKKGGKNKSKLPSFIYTSF
ncbi:MAG: penicillin-binding protein 2 [Deltaproteobacteria bacterium]|jgi:penicillin-binding protein 2|nr:penicillin-binding protein 2 [Deltaproteobacteria bacterium]